MATRRTTRKVVAVYIAVICYSLAVAAPAQAGIRADLSGDAVVDFQTTMDMPFVTVGNPGNLPDTTGYGAVDYTYNIGKFEVTAGQYTEFLNAVAATDTYDLWGPSMSGAYGCGIEQWGSSGSYTYSVAAVWADRPVNYVSWGDAARFTNWLTNGMPTGVQGLTTTEDGSYFLNGATGAAIDAQALTRKSPEDGGRYYIPSDYEWYKAAYHKNDGVTGNYFAYPTSSDAAPSNDLIDPDPGNNATFKINSSDFTIGSPYWCTEAGEFENSESPYGTFDQGGNLWEWTEKRFLLLDGYYDRGLRGASCIDTVSSLSSSYPGLIWPAVGDSIFGFRVSEVPEPATLSLLAVGGLALLRRRRRQTTSKSETQTRRSRTMLSKNISQIAIVMAALLGLAMAGAANAGVIFSDDFDGPTLAPEWLISPGEGSHSLTANPGSLRYTIDAYQTGRIASTVPDIYGNFYAKALWLVRPFFGEQWLLQMAVTYDLRPAQPTNCRNMYFTVREPGIDGTIMASVGRVIGVNDGSPYGNSLHLFAGEPGDPGSTTIVAFPNSSDPLPPDSWYFEIERDGDDLSIRASNDGDDSTFEYQHNHTYTAGYLVNAHQDIEILGHGWKGSNDPPGYADFDFITVVPEPATLSLLAVGGLALLRRKRRHGASRLLRRRQSARALHLTGRGGLG